MPKTSKLCHRYCNSQTQVKVMQNRTIIDTWTSAGVKSRLETFITGDFDDAKFSSSFSVKPGTFQQFTTVYNTSSRCLLHGRIEIMNE
jgi:hypothetical protein